MSVEDARSRFALFSTSIGECGIAWRDDLLIATQLPERSAKDTAARLATRTRATAGDPPPEVQRAADLIATLLEGDPVSLQDIECDFSGIEPFAAKVYAAARQVPAGKTCTYGDIAAQLGDKRLARGVGSALGRNPFPIVVPCHRVVGAGGKLTGFSAYGGVDTKLRMLRIERAIPGETASLFDDLPP